MKTKKTKVLINGNSNTQIRNSTLTASLDWRLNTDPVLAAKLNMLANPKIDLNNEQITQFFNDPSPDVRISLINREDILLPSSWIDKGLCDKDKSVRYAFASKIMNGKNGCPPTNAQIKKCLTDESWVVRIVCVRSDQITLTESQIAAVIGDGVSVVACALLDRKDFVFKAEYEPLFMKSSSVDLQCYILERSKNLNEDFIQRTIRLPTEEKWQEQMALFSNPHVSLNIKPSDLIDLCDDIKRNYRGEVLTALLKREDVPFSKEMVESFGQWTREEESREAIREELLRVINNKIAEIEACALKASASLDCNKNKKKIL